MNPSWVLMFYSMPSKPERNRLRIYRRLQKEGTLSLKDGVHILPFSDDRYEFFQWLSQEIKTLGGEMSFVTIERIEMIDNGDIIALFKTQAEISYGDIEQRIKNIARELSLIENEISAEQEHTLRQMLKKIVNDFEALYKIDFFYSSKGQALQKTIQSTQSRFESALESTSISSTPTVTVKKISDFQGRVWQTRTNPFVDRMASAWLISKYIDSNAEFIFANTIDISDSNIVTYDMNEATFTHVGNLCTFEVLLKSFGIQNNALESIAKIIHMLDINDDKFVVPEADGIKLILIAIRSGSFDDNEIIQKSSEIFDYLYLMLADN